MNPKDLPLIQAFVEREAQDYTPAKSKQWIDETTASVLGRIARLRNTDFLIVESLGNMGSVIRSVKFDLYKSRDTKHFTYHLALCSCGDTKHVLPVYRNGT